ncbi:TetR/AcrR family transcriptional regulator [Polycladomyces subterraneus]|uniref:TetR/AcrR family transcriptional regulator n=1 Tax=Polycladomyces subterraneus TaxID=1016997 RepID=A0ABT8ILY8_9BACL|nr:TetR/AcrR family transcriptional regulator [Polycladomyces subterraneus]MDN4593757.1 TetR/AcrR family transcriptional regulator [Polycladomyces subterraneus]
MSKKSWDEWVHDIAEQYDLDLKADKETQKQKKILEAAIHVFAEKGFSGASTSEIAERAGVAEATIFKHYRTKKGLLLRLVIPAIARVAYPYIATPVLNILNQDKPLEELLREVVIDRKELLEKNWKTLRIILVESLFHPEIREALKIHVARNVFRMASEKIEELKSKGKLRADLPNHVILRGIMSQIGAYLLARNVIPELLAQGGEDEEIGWIVDMLINGIAPKPDSKTDSEADEESH